VDALVRTVDVAPTITDLAGLPPLGNVVSGVSLVPLLTGAATDLKLSGYTETPEPFTRLRLSAIRAFWSGRWKYMWSAQPQLFDLESDPGELHDVIAEHADTAEQLQRELRALLEHAPPPLAAAPSAPLASGELSRLESMGYVGLGDGRRSTNANGLGTFAPAGLDPYVHVATITAYEHARELMERGQFSQVATILSGVLAELPEALAAQRDLASALVELGQRDEAAAAFEKALALAPDDTRARVEYASLRMRYEQWDLAIAQAQQAVHSSPRDYAAHFILGVCYGRSGKLEEAAKALEQAVQLEPQIVNARQALGQTYYQLRRFPDAIACFQQILAVEPNSEPARSGLAAAQHELRTR
jgi:tetratricopeptide (TPR) repeat protein